jgi:periplasmic divalent cation tolerance protein
MTDKIVVLSTCASEDEAEKLARLLLDRRLAACVSVIPAVRSFYHWKGAIESSDECLLLIKSSRDRFADLCEALEQAHSYEVPEVLALPVVAGAANYLEWLGRNLEPGTP